MNSSKLVGVWRPVMGVAVVGAMALGVSALAGPRGTDQAVRGTVKSGPEVTRLVTGNPEQINTALVGETLVLAFNPVNPPPGMPAYPAGVTINGNELTIDRNNKTGFRAWFHAQVSDWDVTHTGTGFPAAPRMATYQIKIDCTGYYHSDCKDVNPDTGDDGLDLIPALQACTTNADCRGTGPGGFGEGWVKCVPGGVGTICPAMANCCENGYLDSASATTNNPQPEGLGKGWCANDGCAGFGVGTGTCNYLYFAVSDNGLGHLDEGGLYYGGTLVLDLPADAKGKYIVNLNKDETFGAAPGTPPDDIPTKSEEGFVINYVVGSCCYGLGSGLSGCADGTPLGGGVCLNRSDCAALPPPNVFAADSLCANPPTADECSECTGNIEGVDLTCNDNDACTTETCQLIGTPPVGVCQRGFISGFDPVKPGGLMCCDKVTGALTAKDDNDVCTADSCSSALDNRGSAVHDPAGALGVPCDDGNACAVNDRCNGLASDANGGCVGTGVVGLPCVIDADCQFGGQSPTATCVSGLCDCSVTPKITYVLNTATPKTCEGGFNDGDPCAKDADCPGGGICAGFPTNCFDEGEKVTAFVNVGVAAEPVNGGEFLIEYDPSCVTLNSVNCEPPYVRELYRSSAASSVFIACGVDPFGGVNGPLGNVNILSLSFTMIGQCNNCFLCFGDDNPQHTFLVDAGGYKIPVETQCKEISENGDLVLNVPDNVAVNSDCDVPAATVNWAAPSASFSCGDVTLSCRGAHESGFALSQAQVMNGGLLPQGASSFCCYATALDKCEQTAGCAGDTNFCADGPDAGTEPDGCWTVEISDQTSLDIHVQLEPPLFADEITRCIEFCLYGNCLEAPYCFSDDVLFGGLYNYVGKANGTIKVPKGKWGCITAQDQLHSLRSCDVPDCIDGNLMARFKGDPAYGGNWLIMGNLDAYKKAGPSYDPNASLDVIDILDFGKFVASFLATYDVSRTYGCHEGPHADINGDGIANALDYAYIVRNFMVSSKDCCCGPSAADLPPALSEVTIEELRQMGQGDLAVADLNGDGVLNAADMDAFAQGVRPVKANDRKGGKGLRSGR